MIFFLLLARMKGKPNGKGPSVLKVILGMGKGLSARIRWTKGKSKTLWRYSGEIQKKNGSSHILRDIIFLLIVVLG
jgi:hypothetical protein